MFLEVGHRGEGPVVSLEEPHAHVRVHDVPGLIPERLGHRVVVDLPDAGLDACRPVWYCNRTMRTWLRRQARQAVKNSTLTMDMVAGRPVLSCNGIPIKRWDSLTATETGI